METQLKYRGAEISLEIQKEPRKSLTITVRPDKSVLIKAPIEITPDKLELFLQKKTSWILAKQRYFEQFLPLNPPRRYLAGESHYYLGRPYRLKLKKHRDERVVPQGGCLTIHLPYTDDSQRIKTIMKRWYEERAEAVINRRVFYHQVLMGRGAASPGVDRAPVITYRWLAKRWGSCSPHGRITLNYELIKTPVYCIDYILVHELCHVEEPSHNPKFFRKLETILPDWKARKEKLEKILL